MLFDIAIHANILVNVGLKAQWRDSIYINGMGKVANTNSYSYVNLKEEGFVIKLEE